MVGVSKGWVFEREEIVGRHGLGFGFRVVVGLLALATVSGSFRGFVWSDGDGAWSI